MDIKKSIIIFTCVLATILLIGQVQWGLYSTKTTESIFSNETGKTNMPIQSGIGKIPDLAIGPTIKYFSLPGEHVSIIFTFCNSGSEAIYLNSFPPVTKVWRLGDPNGDELIRTFQDGGESIKLDSYSEYSHTLKWDQRDEDGNQVGPGSYIIDVYNIQAESSGIDYYSEALYPDGFTVAKVLINHPQGSLNEKIKVNQSETVGNITVTLQHVELSDNWTKIYTLAQGIPSFGDVSPPPGKTISYLGPPMDLNPPSSWYKVDDHPLQEAIGVGLKMSEEGVVAICKFNPIRSDTKYLTFTIEDYGGRQALGVLIFL